MQGGVGDCTNEIAKGLARLGVEAHVLTAADPSSKTGRGSQQPDTERECDVDIHRLVRKWNWSALRLITRTARELKPTVLHIQYQTGAFGMHSAINFLPRLVQTPFSSPSVRESGWGSRPVTITTFHDLKVPYLFPKAGRVREWVTRFLARSSDAVIATNEEDFLSLQAWGLGQLLIVPIGSNIATAPPPDYRRGRVARPVRGRRRNDTALLFWVSE